MMVKFYKSTASLFFKRTTNHHRLSTGPWGPPLMPLYISSQGRSNNGFHVAQKPPPKSLLTKMGRAPNWNQGALPIFSATSTWLRNQHEALKPFGFVPVSSSSLDSPQTKRTKTKTTSILLQYFSDSSWSSSSLIQEVEDLPCMQCSTHTPN